MIKMYRIRYILVVVGPFILLFTTNS